MVVWCTGIDAVHAKPWMVSSILVKMATILKIPVDFPSILSKIILISINYTNFEIGMKLHWGALGV